MQILMYLRHNYPVVVKDVDSHFSLKLKVILQMYGIDPRHPSTAVLGDNRLPGAVTCRNVLRI